MNSRPDHAAPPREEEGRITYSRDSLLSVRRAASEACRDNKLLAAAIDACRSEYEAASSTWETTEPAGSGSRICARFFSTGCRYGDGCRFLHHLPGGDHEQTAVAKKMDGLSLGVDDAAPAPAPAWAPYRSAAPATVKARLCKNHGTPKGCRWGGSCHLAHGEAELGKPMGPGSSFKTRLCVSFVSSGSCAFGCRCHFAHGQDELRSSDAPQ